jgi:hypothetical protein
VGGEREAVRSHNIGRTSNGNKMKPLRPIGDIVEDRVCHIQQWSRKRAIDQCIELVREYFRENKSLIDDWPINPRQKLIQQIKALKKTA